MKNNRQIRSLAAPAWALQFLLVTVAFLGWTASSGHAATINSPRTINTPRMSNGYSVDWCLHWGVDCGKPAADQYCRLIGYPAGAARFSTDVMHPTWVLGDNKVCDQGYCTGFTSIQCATGSMGILDGTVTEPAPLTGEWMLTSACRYPTTDKQNFWGVLSLTENAKGRISGGMVERNMTNLYSDLDGRDPRNQRSGNQVQLILSPAGWVSELILNGTVDGSRMDGTITHYGKVDCSFVMTRK